MKIRKVNKQEWEKIADIEYNSGYKWRQNKEKTYEMIKQLFNENYQVYLLEVKEPIGYFALTINKKCSLDYLAVKKKFQGKGYGRLLLKKAIQIAKRKPIELAVWAKNFPALALYNKFGFYVTQVKENYYPNKDNKLIMIKEK